MAIRDPEQIKAMLEVGFDYVCQKDKPSLPTKAQAKPKYISYTP